MSDRLLRGLWVLCLIFCITPAVAEALEVSATAAVLMDADMGQVLYEKNGDRQMLIASTTKIMTALVVLEHAAPDDVITVTPNHMAEGSSMYLRAGETVRVEELLYGLLLCSGNDAALALTECAGGLTPFVALMNEKAAALGMAHTSFANPNGLDADGHYSTARDMAVLAAAAVENPTFRRICSSRSVTIGQRTMENHNRLLRQVEGCVGLKTGYTQAAGRTLVSCTERDGCRLVAVTLQDGNDWADHAALYDYGFRLTAPRRGVQTGAAAPAGAADGGMCGTAQLEKDREGKVSWLNDSRSCWPLRACARGGWRRSGSPQGASASTVRRQRWATAPIRRQIPSPWTACRCPPTRGGST